VQNFSKIVHKFKITLKATTECDFSGICGYTILTNGTPYTVK